MDKRTLNGLGAISEIINIYELYKDDVVDLEQYQEQIVQFLTEVFNENNLICSDEGFNAKKNETEKLFATIEAPLSTSDKINDLIKEKIPDICIDNNISMPFFLDFTQPISMTIDVGSDEETAFMLSRDLLLLALQNNTNMHFRCADFVRNGNFFSELYGLVNKLHDKSSGVVYTKAIQFEELISELEKNAARAMAALSAGNLDYNSTSDNEAKTYICALYLKESERDHSEFNRLLSLVENAGKTGLSFIIIGNKDICEQFNKGVTLQVRTDTDGIRLSGYKTLNFKKQNLLCNKVNEEIDAIIEKHRSASQIETSVFSIKDLGLSCQGMDSTDVLRIPFAYDNNRRLQYFEIGGEGPSHPLSSWSTRSGISGALHTLIMQIIYNYHPDDVEIWAIDYKAVEFDAYINCGAPHFRVIAYDTSTEFSLSLLDLLYEEYELRMKKFLNAGVRNISEYRAKYGAHSMPRIVVFIDEFQLMTQAVQTYTGNKDYKTILENLLRLTRAMGISFIFCSQTIASGLSGLTNSARDQIGGRLSLKHDDDNEIRETLMLWGPDNADVAMRAKKLRRGEGIYRRTRFTKDETPDGAPYEYKNVNILFLNDELKRQMIDEANEAIGDDCNKKDTIFVRGGGRIEITEKDRHPLMQFVSGIQSSFEDECIDWYPAAPATLADYFRIPIERSAGANMLMVGENDALRDSVILHSICGFLMDPHTKVYANFLDPDYSDRRRIISILENIHTDRFVINEGVLSVIDVIKGLERIRPLHEENKVFIWYGLEKLKNELFLLFQDEDEQGEENEKETDRAEMLNDLMGFLTELNAGADISPKRESKDSKELSYEECVRILKKAFEVGAENGYYHFAIYNNYKGLKKNGIISLDCFENRIGTKMSVDDSFELFGSSLAIEKADENTVIYYPGSGKVVPLRPYLMPDNDWIDKFNTALQEYIDKV